jgi:hypothetical protein
VMKQQERPPLVNVALTFSNIVFRLSLCLDEMVTVAL